MEEKIAKAVAFFAAKYRDLPEGERVGAIRAAEQSASLRYTDAIFQWRCPACDSLGWVDAAVDVDWDYSDYEWVAYPFFTPVSFSCGVCQLYLSGDEVGLAMPNIELPPDFDPSEISEPPDIEDLRGYGLDDVHPYPPPH